MALAGTWSDRIVTYKLEREDAQPPEYQHSGDAGADLRAAESALVEAGERALVGTGVAVELPEDYCAFVWSRSGLSVDHGIEAGAGLIDPNYRGTIKVVLYNHGDEDYAVEIGDRIAQLVIVPMTRGVFTPRERLSSTVRETEGLGSTGT